MNYKNNIILGIKLDPKNQTESALNSIINKLNNKAINLDVKINENTTQSLKNISNMLDILKLKSNGLSLGDLDKVINNSTVGLSKLNGELLKISQTNYSDGTKKLVSETATAIGEVVTQTTKLNKDNTVMGNGIAKTTTNFIEQAKAIKEVEKAQESLNNLKLIDKNKVDVLKSLLNTDSIGSTNELNNLLSQVKQLENEEQKLLQIQKEKINLANQMANAREKSEINAKTKDESWNLEQAKAINKAKDDNYKNTLKEAEAEKEVQTQIQNKIKLLEIQKSSLQRQYGEKIDTSFIDQSINKLKTLDSISLKNLKNEFSNINIGIKESVEQVKQGESAFGKFQATLGSLGMYISGAVIFTKIAEQLRSGIEYVKYLDSSFTDMAMTMSISKGKFDSLSESIDNMGKKLGINSREIHDIGRVYANAQSSVEEILAKLKSASELSNISGMSGLETTKTLQSTVNAFDLLTEAEGNNEKATQRIGDVFTSISKNMAYDFSSGIVELNNAIKESGSVASESGMSLEQYSAYMGALIERTGKTGSELGTFWKMLTARVQQIKTIGDELGITNKEMGKAENALTSIGVSVRGENGSLRDMDSILKDVYSQWGGLSDQQKSFIAEGVAGNRHRATFLSLMKSMTSEQNLYNEALNGTGSLEEANKVKAESFEGRLNTMKDTVQELYSTMLNGDMLKGGISVFTNMIGGINSVVKTLGTIPSTFAIILTSLNAFNSKFNNTMKSIQPSFLKNWIQGIENYRNKLNSTDILEQKSIISKKANIQATREQVASQKMISMEYVTSKLKLAQLEGGLIATTVAEKACAISTKALGLAFSMMSGLLIGALFSAFSSWINKTEETKQANEQLLSSIQSLKTEATDISNLKDEFVKLSKEIENGGLTAEQTKEKKQQLAEVYSQLISKAPELEGVLGNETLGYQKQANAIQDVINAKREEAGIKAEKYVSDNKISDDTVLKEVENLNSQKRELEKYSKMATDTSNTEKARQNYRNYATSIKEGMLETKKAIQETITTQETLNKLGIDNGISSGALNSAKFAIENTKLYKNALDENSASADNNNNSQSNLANGLNNVGNEASNAETKFKDLSESFNELSGNVDIIDKVIKEMSELGGITASTYSQMISKHPEVLATLVKEGDTIENLKTQRKEYMAFMEEEKNKAVRLADEKYNHIVNNNNAESESNSTMNQNKSNSDTDFNNTARKNSSDTTDQNGKNYGTDSGNFDNTSNVKLGSDAGFQNGWRQNTADSINELGGFYETDTINFQSAMSSKMSMLNDFKGKFANMANAITLDEAVGVEFSGALAQPFNDGLRDSMGKLMGSDLNKTYNDSLRKTKENLQNIANKIDTSGINLVNPNISKVAPSIASGGSGGSKGGSGKSGGSGGSANTEKQVADITIETDAYELQKNKIEQVNTAISVNEDKQKSLLITEEEKLNLMKEEQGLYQDKWMKLNELAFSYDEERRSLEAYLRTQNLEIDALGNILNKNQVLKEWESWANASSGEEKEKRIQQTKDFQKQIERYSQVVQTELPKVEAEWRNVGNEIQELDKKMKDSFKDTVSNIRDKVIEGIKEDISKAQEDKEEKLKKLYDKKLAKKDSEIKRLQDELNSLNDSKEDNEKKLAKLKAEREAWTRDNSVFAKSKISSLDESISDLEKQMKKDDLQSKIDDLNDEKKSIQDAYDDEVKSTKKKYEKKLTEQEIYNKANKLLQEKNIDEIQKFMKLKDESFKDIGLAWGENLCKPIQTQIQETFKAIESLQEKAGIKSEVKTKTEYKEWYDDNGYLHVEGSANVAQASNGGRTPSNIDDGRAMILHSDEMISSADDTKKFDETHDFAKQASKVLEDLNFIMPEMYNNMQLANPPMLDFNKIASSIINNTNDNSDNSTKSVTWKNNITQNIYTKDDSYLNDRAFNKLLRNQAGIFK
ncbi:hypothetical protein FDF26_14060 [Clostridium botulinum]|nr:hypothetical protein [Clostridium botulinum]